MNFEQFWTTAQPILINGAFQVGAAIALWVVGTWLINLAVRLLSAALERLRPFKVGDFVSAGGVTGTVKEIGLFGTAINTPDNVLTIVGNNKIFGDSIQNYSANAYRRVDLKAQLAQSADHAAAIALLRDRVAKIPNVLAVPAPDVEILDFTPSGPVLAVRPYCSNEHYWQVYFDTNRSIRESFGEAGFPVPEMPFVLRNAG
jgi:small conductance mechanosensitive channel